MWGALISTLGSMIAGWAGQKIANRGTKNRTIAQKMRSMGSHNALSGIHGARGNITGPEGGYGQLPMYEPDVMARQKELGEMGMKGLRGQNFDFGPIREKTLQDFYQNFLPGMQSRFTGIEGDQRSSGYLNMIGGAGKGLETDLAAQEQKYKNQAWARYFDMANAGNKQQYENVHAQPQPVQPSAWQNAGMEIFKAAAPTMTQWGLNALSNKFGGTTTPTATPTTAPATGNGYFSTMAKNLPTY
jgi:hypothetical protein